MPGWPSLWSATLWPDLWSQGKIWAGSERVDLDISGAITVGESNAAWLADAHLWVRKEWFQMSSSASSIWSILLSLLYPTSSIQSGVLPQVISLPCCHSWCCHLLLQPVTWFNWEHAGCHLQERLRTKVAIIAIRGSAEPPQKLVLLYDGWPEHPELLSGCEEALEDVCPWKGTSVPCGTEEVLPKFNNCVLN